ncbi:uncharacterized protein AB675_2933 [Cyphellophora attinorum]|uniref:Uncharacterized protein n=1 Tax=Cyphellophora attinorum TaxID=1664694 RepID=A0A0N1HJ69_9EURO|nr:uncharacterized protein AB675_2933 [Phialophora attinorum]KPI36400.1 hypothetical protein AB675_2933 [Phialophora attinorum]
MVFTKRVLNRGLLAVGSILLAITSLSLVGASLWLLARFRAGVAAVSLATAVSAFAAAAFAALPATGLATYTAFKSMKCRDPPHQCLPTRLSTLYRWTTYAAIYVTMIPCGLGLSFALSATCHSDESPWHRGLSCELMKVVWALSMFMLILVVLVLLPLRRALVASALPPVKKESDTESTSSLEKPEQFWPPHVYANFDRPATREQQRWLQRRNSLSSQKAIYPYAFEPRRSASYTGYITSPGSHYSFQRNTMRSFSDSQPTLYDPHRSGSFSTNSRPMTAISSTGSMYSRRYRQPDPNCPAIPESPSQSIDLAAPKPKAVDAAPSLPPAPPPAWCPPLSHAPLSSDPAIRALTGSPAGQVKTLASSTISSSYAPGNGFSRAASIMPSLSRATTTQTSILNISRPSTASTDTRSASTASTSRNSSRNVSPPPPLPPLPSPPTQPPPAVPRRAPGHAAAQPSTPTLVAYGPGIATTRTLRRPEMIGKCGVGDEFIQVQYQHQSGQITEIHAE